MSLQIFPEPFYNQFLRNGERIGVTPDKRLEILPPESFCSRLWRFFTFQQDPDIDRVHSRLKELSLQRRLYPLAPDIQRLYDEIHAHGAVKFRYLLANLCKLRSKLDRIGHMNCLSVLILDVINIARSFFGASPIKLKTYTVYELSPQAEWNNEGPDLVSDFDISLWPNDAPELTEAEQATCRFSADSPDIRRTIQRLEKGLEEYWEIERTYKCYDRPDVAQQVMASLEITFDLHRQCFLASINNFFARSENNPRLELITPTFANDLRALPDERKTFRYLVSARNAQGTVTEHQLTWVAQPTERAPFKLRPGTPLVLEPGIHYTFYNEQHQEVFSLKITLNEQR